MEADTDLGRQFTAYLPATPSYKPKGTDKYFLCFVQGCLTNESYILVLGLCEHHRRNVHVYACVYIYTYICTYTHRYVTN